MAENFLRIIAHKTEQTRLFWEVAQKAYAEFPDSIPEVIYPLLDETWGDEEVIATRSEIRDVQAWATGMPGWKTSPQPLEFAK